MKFLLNINFAIIMKGAAVDSKAIDKTEFIYDTEGKEKLTISQMKEISNTNKFKISGNKTPEKIKSFNEQLLKLKNIPEKKEMSDSEKVLKIVEAGFKAEKSEDDILVDLVTKAGIKFNNAIKMMKVAMIELGFMVSSKDRFEKAKAIMDEEAFEPEDTSEVLEMAKQLVKEINSTSEAQALKEIRKYCKANSIDMPKSIKVKKVPLDIRVIAFLMGDNQIDKKELTKFLSSQGSNEKSTVKWNKKIVQLEAELKNKIAA